ncbi:hypothetical protein [Runella sp.]|uniref:hypothetical protein n=1 Tax=Runella sp. TaxID=1960881 RepID=UPI003D149FAC
MKKSLFLVFALVGLFFASCNRENINAAQDDLTELVQLSAARSAATTDTITKQKCKGKLVEITAADLPAAITAYINTNYAGAEIQFAGKDTAGQIVVGLKLADGTHKGLIFNADGTFSKALEKYPKGAKLTKVEVSALPSAITGYAASHYADYTVKAAGRNDTGEYFLIIEKTTGTEAEVKASRKVLQFNADGTFKQETTPPSHPEGPMGKRPKHGK